MLVTRGRIPGQRSLELSGTVTQAETRGFQGQPFAADEGVGDDVVEGDRAPTQRFRIEAGVHHELLPRSAQADLKTAASCDRRQGLAADPRVDHGDDLVEDRGRRGDRPRGLPRADLEGPLPAHDRVADLELVGAEGEGAISLEFHEQRSGCRQSALRGVKDGVGSAEAEGECAAVPVDLHIRIEHRGDPGRWDAETAEDRGDPDTAAVDPDVVWEGAAEIGERVGAVEPAAEKGRALEIAAQGAAGEDDAAGEVFEGKAGGLEVVRSNLDLNRLVRSGLDQRVDVDGAGQDSTGLDDAIQDREIDGARGGDRCSGFAAETPVSAQRDAVAGDGPRWDVETVFDLQSSRNREAEPLETRDLDAGVVDPHETESEGRPRNSSRHPSRPVTGRSCPACRCRRNRRG